MPFIENADYLPVLKDEIKTVIIENNSSILTEAALRAQSQMEGYLRKRYDVSEIFNKTGAARNQSLVMLLVDMIVYHVLCRVHGRNIPEERANRYDYAIAWLDRVAAGDIEPDLPKRTDEDGNAIGLTRFGSVTPTGHDY